MGLRSEGEADSQVSPKMYFWALGIQIFLKDDQVLTVDRADTFSSNQKEAYGSPFHYGGLAPLPLRSCLRPELGPLSCLALASEELKTWSRWSDLHSGSALVPLPSLKPIPQNTLPSWVMKASCVGMKLTPITPEELTTGREPPLLWGAWRKGPVPLSPPGNWLGGWLLLSSQSILPPVGL